ncbi:DNA (cytosine-5-)-methyltransferase [Rhodococcus coprophilus]|uniref:DNA cytosine methyltransferase n=1 Tax=Rhodococcus coprophilus TaxID=38310 RepID=UPI00341BAF4D
MAGVIEICAGAGGQALGLERAGFQHELAVELNPDAHATLKKNRPHWKLAEPGDAANPAIWKPSEYSPNVLGDQIDLFAGGVPCPPFSIAGKRLGSADERDLFAWAVEQTPVIAPRAVLLENVRGLSSPRFAGYRQFVLDRFQEFGYCAEWRLIHASDFGVPQVRPRFVLIAMLPEYFQHFHWPEPSAVESPTVGKVLRKLMGEEGWKGTEEWASNANSIAPTIVGGSTKHGGADLGPTGAKRAWAKLGVDAHGVADRAPLPDDKFEVGPRLTNKMVARLQGWDENDQWKFVGKKTSTYRQIGNAFPPPAAEALGRAIRSAILRETLPAVRAPQTGHDPIYRILRDRRDFVLSSELVERSGLALSQADVLEHLGRLQKDFEIEEVETAHGIAYRLGAFRAFVGQGEHPRHAHFAPPSPR